MPWGTFLFTCIHITQHLIKVDENVSNIELSLIYNYLVL